MRKIKIHLDDIIIQYNNKKLQIKSKKILNSPTYVFWLRYRYPKMFGTELVKIDGIYQVPLTFYQQL